MASLTSLAEEILSNAKQIDAFLESKNVPRTSFDQDTLANLPEDFETVRANIVNLSSDMKKLVQGPSAYGTELILGVGTLTGLLLLIELHRVLISYAQWTDILVLRVIYHFSLAHAVPLEGSASYADIAAASGLTESLVFRFVRAAITNKIFDEDESGQVQHTTLSRLMVTDPGFYAAVGLHAEEFQPAADRYIDALQTFGQDSQEAHETAFSLMNGSNQSIFDILAQNPERTQRFAAAMQYWTKDDAWDVRHVLNAFDWASIDHPDTTIFDIGGGNGHVSRHLAENTQNMKFVVQDLPRVTQSAAASLPMELRHRVDFVAHSFLEPQQPSSRRPTVFLLRWIVHNWPEKYCVQILRGLIPAMSAGTKLFIFEYVMDDLPVKEASQKISLSVDILMAICFNGQERSRDGFRRLLAQADPRFVIDAFRRPPNSAQTLVEVTWRP